MELEPRTPAQLREEVEVLHDYQLAYYHWDYPNDDYWLWPLFESSERALGAGGSNFLGYHNDPVLDSQLRRANAHRDFKAVQACTHTIHALIYEKMPFIPLWQLDTHIAYHEGLKPVRLDPFSSFRTSRSGRSKNGKMAGRRHPDRPFRGPRSCAAATSRRPVREVRTGFVF